MNKQKKGSESSTISPWWRHGLIIVFIVGFSVLIWMTVQAYINAPPIPEKVTSPTGEVIFTQEDILAGQEVFLKYGLMNNGSIWGHGAYLGPDFSAEYLHTLVLDANDTLARQKYNQAVSQLVPAQLSEIESEIQISLKQNRYNPENKTLLFTQIEAESYKKQIEKWTVYFSDPTNNFGLTANTIQDPAEIQNLTAFFSWTAWASAANRPGKSYSYTNNFPYDPAAGNYLTDDAILWSAISLIALLGGIGAILFIFGRFNFLGWKNEDEHIHPTMLPGKITNSQKAIIKYFVVVTILLLGQGLLGALTAHYRADPGSFYGIDLSFLLPSNLARTWHLQIAIFWIATAYVAGALFLAPSLSEHEPKGQILGINILFGALVFVVLGSILGEFLGINQLLGKAWSLLGNQGWEFLELGRIWQILLIAGLFFWLFLLFRCIVPALKQKKHKEIAPLFLYAAIGIPLFYIPSMFFTTSSNFAIADTWRFWIIHLWVEGFFELFATVMVAIIFYLLGMVKQKTAARVVFLDAILYLGGGIIGTGHHWYWTGHFNVTMALAAVFSALEIVPLTLLTLHAWDFIKLTRGKCDICGKEISIPHKWTFYFLMAVGFWNFLGAGVFGFLINLPVVSYFEAGTMLTPNHGHAALMGVFGMLAIALAVFAFRQVLDDIRWKNIEKYIRVSFWGLNIGLLLMVVLSLFPGGIFQLNDVIQNGYWHARSPEFLSGSFAKTIEWFRMPGDLVFGIFGVIPLVIAALLTYKTMGKNDDNTVDENL
jgi:nitric oxide reductase subunit B